MGISKNEFLLPIILAVLVTTGVALYALKPKNDILVNQIPGVKLIDGTPAPTPEGATSLDQDGVYKNMKYGFEFKYPEEIFSKINIEGQFPGENTYSYYQLSKSSNDKHSTYRLDIYAYKYGEEDKKRPGYGPTLYFGTTGLKSGDTIYQYGSGSDPVAVGMFIRKTEKQGYEGVFYQYEEKFEDYAIGAQTYSMDLLKGNFIYVIRVSTRNKKQLEDFKPKFETMINSFKFL